MLPKPTPKLTADELLQLIEEARNAELCGDVDSLRKILQTVWNIEEPPNFNDYEELLKGELLRLCGIFLSYYGKYSLNRKNYQIRGKDLLINAVEIFDANKISERAAEAKINLAFCNWNLGEGSEAEAILDIVEAEFKNDLFHPTYLRVCINRLVMFFWRQDIDQAIKLIEKMNSPMRFCNDLRLQAMFHNQAGIFYRAVKQYDKAVFHQNEAIRFAGETGNKLFIAINLNNLAYLYKEVRDFQKALNYISKSINEVNKIKYKGFLPHVLDTKALIYLDLDKFENALETIDQSIEFFRQGEDYRGLTEALWTKIRCLLRLNRSEDALSVYGELYQIAIEQIGEVAAEKFAKKLSEEIYVLKHLSFADEITEFKKERISGALIQANGVIGKAAEILHLNSHQALSKILNSQFPNLLDELGFKRRAKRNSIKSQNVKSKTLKNNSKEALVEYKITRVVLTDKNFSFDFKFPFAQFETYYFNKALMRTFGVDLGAVIAVVPVKELETGMLVLISERDKFFVGKTQYDDWAGIYFILDARGNPIPVDEENLVGKAMGFCPVSKVDDKYIKFSRFGT